MDRRVKERLVGASILVMLMVLIVPELLSGPARPPAPARTAAFGRPAAGAPEQVRNVTVDLATSKAPAPEPAEAGGASTAEPAATQAAAASAPTAIPADAAAQAGGDVESNRPDAPAPPRGERPAPQTSRNVTAVRPAGAGWALQLGSFASRANADKLVRQLKTQGFAVYVVSGGTGRSARYRVRVGPMADRAVAAQTAAKLKASGHAASFVPPAR